LRDLFLGRGEREGGPGLRKMGRRRVPVREGSLEGLGKNIRMVMPYREGRKVCPPIKTGEGPDDGAGGSGSDGPR